MPDRSLLPAGRDFADQPAPDLDRVLTLARRRRRVQLAVAGGITGAAAIVAGLLAAPGPSTGSLKTVPPATSSSQHPKGTHGQPVQPNGPAVVGTDAGKGSVSATSRAAGGQAGAPAATRPSKAQPAASSYVGPPHRIVSYDASKACNGSGPTPATGWCSYYTGATSGRPGQGVILATDVCRLPGQPAQALTSDNGQQAEFTIAPKAYPPMWTWSHNRHFAPASTSITVDPGSCVEWFVSWRVVDDPGRPMPAGSYELGAEPSVAPPGSNSVAASTPLKFTVTN